MSARVGPPTGAMVFVTVLAVAAQSAEAVQPGYFETRAVQRGAWEMLQRRLQEVACSSAAISGGAPCSSLAVQSGGPPALCDGHNEAKPSMSSRKGSDRP